MITNFNLFNESRLSDQLKLSGDEKSFLYNKIKQEKDKDFSIEKKLIKYVTIHHLRVGKSKVRFNIDYHDTISHDIKEKIQKRTSIKSVEEFNDLVEKMLNNLFPEYLEQMFRSGKYGFIFSEINLSIVFSFDINEYLNNDYKIKIITLLPQEPNKTIKNFLF